MPEPITDPDLTNETLEYWDDVLASHGLSMKRGARPNMVVPIGDVSKLVRLEKKNSAVDGEIQTDRRKSRPKGYGPDSFE